MTINTRTFRWSFVAGASLLALTGVGSMQAKPIDGCHTNSLNQDFCAVPPTKIASSRSSEISTNDNPRIARVTEADSRCAALQGTHQAREDMLAGIESRLRIAQQEHRSARSQMDSLRRSRASEVRINTASARLSEATANLAILQAEYTSQTVRFSRSLNRLSNGCGTS